MPMRMSSPRPRRVPTSGIAKRVMGLGLLGVLAGCSAILSFDNFTGKDPLAAGCPLKRWPERPNTAPGGTNDNIVGVTRAMKLTSASGGTIGFDLDGLCTCPDKGSCRNPKAAQAACDIAGGGIDNSAGAFLGAFQVKDQDLADGILKGRHGIAVRLDRYNGLPNDPDVTVTLYNVVGVDGKLDGTGTAKLDGTDVFTVDKASTGGPELLARFVAVDAYVAGGVLVAPLDFDLRFVNVQPQLGPLAVTEAMKSVRLVGKIDDARNGKLTMKDALLVGRIPVSTMFARAASASSCSDAGLYPQFLEAVCGSLDLPTEEADDGKDKACDALSFAMKLEIGPGNLAPESAASPLDQTPCEAMPRACK